MGIFDGGIKELQIQNLNLKVGGYAAGDAITGEVIMVAKKEIKCREFVVSLVGTAITEWRRPGSGSGDSPSTWYLGNEKIMST